MNTPLCNRCKKRPPSDDGVHCLPCRVALMPPLHTRLDLDERINVLEGLEANLRARLLNAERPQHMLEHAAHLEREAQILLDKASAIRAGVLSDATCSVEIRLQLDDVLMEQHILRMCLRRGWKVARIRKMIERLKRVEAKENG